MAIAGGRKAQGEGTRKAILEAAVHIASAEGLEGLTIGRLAADLSMSKSGLFEMVPRYSDQAKSTLASGATALGSLLDLA